MDFNWMVGKEFSLGTVQNVSGDTATIKNQDGQESNRPVSEILEEEYEANS